MFCRLHIVQHPIATRWPISVLQNTRWQSTPGLVGQWQWGQFARSLISPTSRYTHIIQKKYQIKNTQIEKQKQYTIQWKEIYISSKKNASHLEAHPRQLNHNWHFMGSLQIFQTPIKPHTTFYYRQFQPTRGNLCNKRKKLLQSMHVLAKRVGDSKALYWSKTWATLIVYLVSLFSCLLDRQNGDFSSSSDPSLGWWIMWE